MQPTYATGGVITVTGGPIKLTGCGYIVEPNSGDCDLTAAQVRAMGAPYLAALRAHLAAGGDDARS